MNEQWRQFARDQYELKYGRESVVDNRELDGLFRQHDEIGRLLEAMRDYFVPLHDIPFSLPPVKLGAMHALDRKCAVAYHFNLKEQDLCDKLAELELEETIKNNVTMGRPYARLDESESLTHSWSGRSGFLD